MKSVACGLGVLVLACGFAWGVTVPVYDVGVAPDSANKKVTVTYRMAETNGGVANVAVDISADAGDSWAVPANTFYPGSDVGPGIPADGSLRQFVWDARADWNNQFSTQMLVRINATAEEAGAAIYFASSGKLYRMNPDGTACTLLCSGLPKTQYMAADKAHNRILISSWYSGSPILAYNVLQGGGVNTLYNGPGYSGGQGLAYDGAARTLFCGLYYNGVYAYNEATASAWTWLVAPDDLSPMIGQRGDLAIDAARSNVYFRAAYNGPCDQCRWIWRVNYDGTGLTQIIQANDSDALALDLAADKIYFSDQPGGGNLKRANLDGSNPETLLTMPGYDCYDFELDVPGNKIYMYLVGTDNWSSRTIARAALDGSGFEILKEFQDTGEGYGLCFYGP